MNFRLSTPPARYFTPFSAKSFRIGSRQLRLSVKYPKITDFLIIRFHPHTRSAPNTVKFLSLAVVYSRITGYYRPVQNFNDGKAQEFSERKEYVIERSHLTHFGVLEHKEPEHNCECQPKAAANLLFTTKTCPNCKIAKALLEKAGIAYENIYANENEDMAKAYDIVTAPTLVVPDGDGVKRLKGVSEIRKYIESL